MEFTVKQTSSLVKIRGRAVGDVPTLTSKTLLAGQSFHYQLALEADGNAELSVTVDSPLAAYISLYAVKNGVMDLPTYPDADDDYLTKEPGLMPDLLLPLALEGGGIRLRGEAGAVWVQLSLPEDIKAGSYPVTLTVFDGWTEKKEVTLTVKVLPASLPAQKTIFTQWFHVDCIADAHGVKIYSEAHWTLIEKYMKMAVQGGINMLLTPVITPPLDTKIGGTRPCTQLVDIEKEGDTYRFDFSRLCRFIDLCDRTGIRYYEISHLFSQWGLRATPNIRVRENGEESYLFGWHVEATAPAYRTFLSQFLPALCDCLRARGVLDRTYFHISDEPTEEHLDAYRYAHDLIRAHIGDCPTLDALSDIAFFERGLVPTPVIATDHIAPFLSRSIENRWVYYCCLQGAGVGNRFLAMPSYRNRILGLQLYKYGVKGFLHWGYNFYYNQFSRRPVNPYLTTSADHAFPSGDPFSVYPGKDGPHPSLRLFVFREALEDIEVCRLLECYVGRESVIEMIDTAAGAPLTFSDYPRSDTFIPDLIERMLEKIATFAQE